MLGEKLTTKQLFNDIFPGEEVEQELTGFFRTRFSKKNMLLGLRLNWHWRLPSFQKLGRVVVGREHILIDLRETTTYNIKYFLQVIIPSGVIIFLVFAWISQSFLFILASLLVFLAIPFLLYSSRLTEVLRGSTSYVIERSWVDELNLEPEFEIKGTVPSGQPYTLGQYLAANEINMEGILSARAAWLGSRYPLSFVKTRFHIKTLKDPGQQKRTGLVLILLTLAGICLLFYGIYIAVEVFNKIYF